MTPGELSICRSSVVARMDPHPPAPLYGISPAGYFVVDPVTLLNRQYTNPEVVQKYSTVGLVPAEEELIQRYFEAGSAILDVACGAGRTSIPLAQRGYRVVAIDLMPGLISVAKKQAGLYGVELDFKVMDVARMPFPEESFQNVLFSFNGFEQVPGKQNRAQALQRMFEVLLPGGHLILTTRSGLAVGRRSLGWVAMTLAHPYHYFAGTPGRSVEFGDKFWGDLYCHYINPFFLKRSSRALGFELVDFNSERNVASGKPATVWTNFSNDRVLYYVFRKSSL